MARYDRIAPLGAPERDQAFPAWPVLRDLEGQDRDADACRRARLRYLALRPVRRLADGATRTVSAESFGRQLEVVRDELRSLNSHDAERVRISRFLRQIEEREPKRVVQALLEFAEQAHAAGHVFAAREYAATAEDLAPGSAATFEARVQAQESSSPPDHAALLESAWNDLRQSEDGADRALIIERLGRALLGLQLLTAADRCFALIAQRQADLAVRSRARAAHALLAAMQKQADTFRERRAALLVDDAEWSAEPRVAAAVHADLAHGCVLAGDLDDAREHVRSAISIARRHSYVDPLQRAEQILSALEQKTDLLLPATRASTEAVQHIAAQIESLELSAPTT